MSCLPSRWISFLNLLKISLVTALLCGGCLPDEIKDSIQGKPGLKLNLSEMVDPSGTLTITDVMQAHRQGKFHPISSNLIHHGFKSESYWFHFTYTQNPARASTAYLLIRNPFLPIIPLYIQFMDGRIVRQISGRSFPRAHWPLQEINPTFPLRLQAGETVHVFFRIKSRTPLTVPCFLYRTEELQHANRSLFFIFYAFYPFLLFIFIYHLFIWIRLRDYSYLVYAIMILSVLVYQLDADNLIHYLIPTGFNYGNQIISATVLFLFGVTIYFVYHFLGWDHQQSRLARINYYMGWVFMAGASIAFFKPYLINRAIYSIGVPLSIYTFGISFYDWIKGNRNARFLSIGLMAFPTATFFVIFTFLGIIPYNLLTIHAVKLGIIFQMLLFALALADRFTTLQQGHRKELENVIESRTRRLITEIDRSKVARHELKIKEQDFRNLFESSPVPLVLVSRSGGEMIKQNERAANLLRINLDYQNDNHNFGEFFHEIQDQTEFYAELSKSNTLSDQLTHMRDTGGTSFWALLSAGKVMYAGQEAYLAGIVDITEEKQTMNELAAAVDAAQKASRAKSEFVANISHEIRTPMNALLGMAEMLSDSELASEQKEYVRAINQAGKSLFNVINDILDIARIESSQIELDHSDFSLIDLLDNLHRIYRYSTETKSLQLGFNFKKNTPVNVRGDSQRLFQILSNLIGNAIKFTDEGSINVEVSELRHIGPLDNPATEITQPESTELLFQIIDTGIGIPSERIPGLFDRFSQIETGSRRKYGGTGLGLAICKELITLMGGDISVSSKPGYGSNFSFRITLPIVDASSDPTVKSVDSSPISKASRSLSLLIVDDAPENLELMRHFLKKTQHQTDFAENGTRALEMTDQKNYDLIFLDIQMPDLDGYAVIKELKDRIKEGLMKPTFILALTAYAMDRDRTRIKNAGFDAHLSKPLSRKALLDFLSTHT